MFLYTNNERYENTININIQGSIKVKIPLTNLRKNLGLYTG